MQRVTIAIAKKQEHDTLIETTDLLKWWSQDRPRLFSSLRFTDITELCSEVAFPRIGDPRLTSFWSRLRSMKNTLSQLSTDIVSESRRPDQGSVFITVPRAVNYFISATPGALPRNKVLSMCFASTRAMDLARVLINSNVFYWYWRVFGDGFLLGVDILGSFPIPNQYDDRFRTFAERLDSALVECTTFKMYRGEKIPSYNFNRRMDLLLDIDDWIVRQVAPDFNLPGDIFAQYKSNSFLRPLDLSELMAAEDSTGDE